VTARRHCAHIAPLLLRVHPSTDVALLDLKMQMGISPNKRDFAQRLISQTGPGNLPDSSSFRPPQYCHFSPARRHTYPHNIFLYQNCNTTAPTLHNQNNTTADGRHRPTPLNHRNSPPRHTTSRTPSVALHRNSRASQLPPRGPRFRTASSSDQTLYPPCRVPSLPTDVALWLHGSCPCAVHSWVIKCGLSRRGSK
jgi:hypothetical protein